MAVDIKILEAHGVSQGAWRKAFEITDGKAEKNEKLEGFKERIKSRIQAGIDGDIGGNWKVLQALDKIWETPYRQTSPTLIADIIENHKTTEEVTNALKAVGINFDDIVIEIDDPKTGRPTKALNVPTFNSVIIPLARAYLEIRWAKLFNDRNLTPLFPFQPSVQTPMNRARTEIVSSRVQLMADQYDLSSAVKEGIFRQLLYGQGMAFTREAWDSEESMRSGDGGEEQYVVREGLRYHFPHPARTFWDQAYPQRSFNHDMGCEYAGYWRVLKYKEIAGNKDFYNLGKVSIGDKEWWSEPGAANFLNTFYGGCVMNWPSVPKPENDKVPPDREQAQLDNSYYHTDKGDQAIVVTEYREKFTPSEVGLGDYNFPVWGRFVCAGDGTVIHAEPVGYTPVIVYKENGDEKRREDASLALKLIPSQDALTNLFTQHILTVKQNLANLTLVDEFVVKPDMLAKIKNLGEKFFRTINIFTFDSQKMSRAQVNIPEVVHSHRFPIVPTDGILQSIKLVIDLAERVLQFSNQEVAQAATHQQTKSEVEKVYAATTNILEFTGNPIDDALAAHARQLYEAWKNYGAEEFVAEIPADHELTESELKELGIINDLDSREPRPQDKKILVTVKKKAELQLHKFAVIPATKERQTNVEAATAVTAFIRDLMNNPITAQAIGASQAIALANSTAKLAGLVLDQPLRDMTKENQANQANEIIPQVMQAVMKEIKEGLVPVMELVQGLGQKVQNLEQLLGLNAASSTQPNPIGNGGISPVPPMAPAAPGPDLMQGPPVAGPVPPLPPNGIGPVI